MPRRKKIMAAGAILILGTLLAWPFRLSVNELDPVEVPASLPADTLRASNGDPIAIAEPALPASHGQITARMTSTDISPHLPTAGLSGFDIANHPALANEESAIGAMLQTSQAVDSTTVPAYNTVATTPDLMGDEWPAALKHVVTNGDTLEKLAQRYLSDPGRALEIFDLNRDQLSNPHLLPIGVELRIPRNPDRIVD